MSPELEARLQALEEQLAADPESESLREKILFEYLGPGLTGEPRRIHHAVEYIRRFPRTVVARAPYVHVHQSTFPAAFAQLDDEWRRLRAEHPGDPELAQGHAALLGPCDNDRAVSVLNAALAHHPEHPGLWLELGRICFHPARRLSALQKARALGVSTTNLLPWLATAALAADDLTAATDAAAELLALVAEARAAYGEKLDWPERDQDLRARAISASDSKASAQALIWAISDHAYRKHWAHTTLGVIAARQGDLAKAREHLRESAAIVHDYRLSSYGPSFLLARELCARNEWNAVADYLEACKTFWDTEPLQDWLQQVRAQQTPVFFDQ